MILQSFLFLKSTNIKNSGSHLLKITLKMIEKYKEKNKKLKKQKYFFDE